MRPAERHFHLDRPGLVNLDGIVGEGHRLKLDPKVTADQRGHGVGVAIEEYTKTSVKDKAVAAKKLEEAVLGKEKIIRMPPRKAS